MRVTWDNQNGKHVDIGPVDKISGKMQREYWLITKSKERFGKWKPISTKIGWLGVTLIPNLWNKTEYVFSSRFPKFEEVIFWSRFSSSMRKNSVIKALYTLKLGLKQRPFQSLKLVQIWERSVVSLRNTANFPKGTIKIH